MPSGGIRNAAVLNHASISSSRGRPLSSVGIADEIGAIVGEAVEVAVLSGRDGQRRAALQRDDRRERPVVQQRARERVGVTEVVELPDAGEREGVRAVGRGAAALQLEAVGVLHRRQPAALEVEILDRLAERVVGLPREAGAAASRPLSWRP